LGAVNAPAATTLAAVTVPSFNRRSFRDSHGAATAGWASQAAQQIRQAM
jgi:hypothetical protein